MGDIHTRAYRAGALDAEDFALADVSDYLVQSETIVWVDFLDPTREQLDELQVELGLHELAVEDALGPHQRPKVDDYASHRFVVAHAISVDRDADSLRETEIDAFVAERWLITVHKGTGFSMDGVCSRWDRSPRLAEHGVSFLLYGLLDAVVDGYFEAVEIFDDYYDEVSGGLFEERPIAPAQQRDWFEMRKALVRFHRVVLATRELVGTLMRRERGMVPEELYPYYQDVYDHVLRVTESTEALRDLASTIVDTNLTLRDYRQNQIVKKVTSWAAIIAVPTLITGYFGMNVPYPGSGDPSGVVASTVLIVAGSGALWGLFRRLDWL